MCVICRTKNVEDLQFLTELDCSGCQNLVRIPDTLTRLTDFCCFDCPKLETIPKKYVPNYKNEYNFLRVPTKNKLLFKRYKKSYHQEILLQQEIKFNEVYWAPDGPGAHQLFEKYKDGIKQK